MQKRNVYFMFLISLSSLSALIVSSSAYAERLSSGQMVAVVEHMMTVCPAKEKQSEDDFRKKVNQALPKKDYDSLFQTDNYKSTREFLAKEQIKANADEVKRLCGTLEQWKKELPKNLTIKDDEMAKQ